MSTVVQWHALSPMEMRAVASIPREPGWQYEPKWDGFRCLAHRDGTEAVLMSKAGQPLTRYFPEVAAALEALAAEHFSLDGELVVPLAGALSFDALQQRIHPASSRVQMLARTTPALYLAFDLLRSEGDDLRAQPLAVRRAALEKFAGTFAQGGTLRLSPATTSPEVVDGWFARVGGALDGVIAKRADAPYAVGRSDAAVKVKKQRTADCVVAGLRYAAGTRDRVGSLLLGLYDRERLLDYIGFCSAFSAEERRSLLERLKPLMGRGGFSGGGPDTAPSRWDRGRDRDKSYEKLDPVLVLEVGFDQVTGGRIRHGTRPLRWRSDKPPQACTTDQLEVAGSVAALLDV